MRLCVRWLHVCAGEEKRTLRKSAFWTGDVTEKRTLRANPHGKAHSARPPACRMRFLVSPTRKMRFSVTSPTQNALFRHVEVASPAQNALFRYVAAREAWDTTPPRQPAGHYGKWLNWANALEQPPASLRGGLRQGPQISVRSLASRKGAVCVAARTQNAPFGEVRGQSALFHHVPSPECAFA